MIGVGRRSPRRSVISDQSVLLKLFAQRIAVDAEKLGRERLIAAGLLEYHFKHGIFDARNHHFVDVMRLGPVQVLKIVVQALADALFYVVSAHAASRSVWFCPSHDSSAAASCASPFASRSST